jgi:hypothetical protein
LLTFIAGLRQKFTMLLSSGDEVIANMSTSSVPDFTVTNLDAAQDYSATVYSFNSKGWAKTLSPIVFRTLPAPGLKEQRRSTGPSDGEKSGTGPWLYILLAAGSTLIVAGAIGAIIIVVKRFRVRVGTRYFKTVKMCLNNVGTGRVFVFAGHCLVWLQLSPFIIFVPTSRLYLKWIRNIIMYFMLQ